MYVEELIQIRKRLMHLDYSHIEEFEKYKKFKKERETLQAIFKDQPEILRVEGIKKSHYGDLIMKDEDPTYRSVYFRCAKNETINAIEKLITGDI